MNKELCADMRNETIVCSIMSQSSSKAQCSGGY